MNIKECKNGENIRYVNTMNTVLYNIVYYYDN